MLLDPSGEQALCRGGRGPEMIFRDAASFAASLAELHERYKPKQGEAALPAVPTLRLALNVAASDGLPLIALVEADPKKRAAAAQELAAEARSHGIAGQAHFVLLDAEEALREFPGFEPGQQLYVLKPDTFARRAEVLTAFPAKEKKLGTKLLALLPSGRIDKAGQRDHVRQAKRAGISWKSAIPISDVNAISRRGAGR
ncbi:MAG: hypothetical protein CMJ94_06915 [Planctomycetes bacterium]|mgnify:CR=1 FL=1|nr:hypothetical protein [Planctomycetota bacterium]